MLVVQSADNGCVIHRVLVLTALVCCTLVACSFVLFADDQLAGASKHQQTELVGGTPAKPAPAPARKQPGQPRRFIDAAASDLTSPFHSVVHSGNAWAERAVPTVLALLVYGLGLGYLARFSRGLS